MLVLDGRPVELDAHLARLEASLTELFPRQAHPALDVPSTPSGALRIAVAPGANGHLAATMDCRPTNGHFAPDNGGQSSTRAASLRSLRLAGGLGAHKWTDRSLLDEAQRNLRDDVLPLIVDENGSALEAARANVFAVRDGALFTPSLDGRILPGVTRARVLELAVSGGIEVHERPLTRTDLLAADEVFLTGSVRGIEPVGAIDGTTLADGGNVTSELSAELRRTWLGAEVG
jgi:para-aminobenzoate synthetase/4-amino-4-deoxychorismate lyase